MGIVSVGRLEKKVSSGAGGEEGVPVLGEDERLGALLGDKTILKPMKEHH